MHTTRRSFLAALVGAPLIAPLGMQPTHTIVINAVDVESFRKHLDGAFARASLFPIELAREDCRRACGIPPKDITDGR